MADFPFVDSFQFVEAFTPDTTNSRSYEVDSYTWVELAASTAEDTNWLMLIVSGHFYTAESTATVSLDIAIGAEDSEEIIIEEIRTFMNASTRQTPMIFLAPISIPAGTRLTCRSYETDTTTADKCSFDLHLFKGPAYASGPCSAIKYIGSATINAGPTTHTKGAYGVIAASTAEDYKGFWYGGYIDGAVSTSQTQFVDVSIGGDGVEKVLMANHFMGTRSDGDLLLPPLSLFMPISIPAGSRLTARNQASLAHSTYRVQEASVWGLV